ncbi:MAG TPA: DUF817 domain-containing protein [Acidobacteriaceae bacterium]|nr:DUF817 domain-containing protein [Acidobacteriaceae bacterium]
MLSATKTRFHAIRLRLENHVAQSPGRARLWEFGLFVFKQGWACLFGATILALILLTRWLWPPQAALARYDFLFLAAVTVQVTLLLTRMESVREAKVILVFHVVGTCMELFKTSVGSWTYPERSFFHVGHVPLFSGFMYASVGSYLARVTRIVDMRYTRYPARWTTAVVAALIYANFFTHHFLPDIRAGLFAALAVLYGRTWVYFRPYQKWRRMPLLAGFCLVALFIWCAENIGTFAAVWVYPQQRHGWHMVGVGKFGAWLLLMVISFVLVTLAHTPQPPPAEALEPARSLGSAELAEAE